MNKHIKSESSDIVRNKTLLITKIENHLGLKSLREKNAVYNFDSSKKLSNYDIRVINQAFKEGQCDLSQIRNVTNKIVKKALNFLNNSNYLEAVEIETAFQAKTASISAIN